MSVTKINADIMDLSDDFAFTGAVSGAGKIIQVVNTQTGAHATTTTATPNDDTIPTSSEGAEFMTLAITPTSASSKLIIRAQGFFGSNSSGDTVMMALFQDSTSSAIATAESTNTTASTSPVGVVIQHFMTAGTASATTFKIRAGITAGTCNFNGVGGSRKMGGTLASSITITEISA